MLFSRSRLSMNSWNPLTSAKAIFILDGILLFVLHDVSLDIEAHGGLHS